MEKSAFFAYSWHLDEDETDVTLIRIYGLNEQNENVCVIVQDFTPYIYIELPERDLFNNLMFWDETKASIFVSRLSSILHEKKPVKTQFMMKQKLYYATFDNGKPKEFPFLMCAFNNVNDIRELGFKLRRPMKIFGLGDLQFRVHEQNASPILQLTSLRNISVTGWIDFVGRRRTKEEQVTHCAHEFVAKWKTMTQRKTNLVARPLIMSYDLEVYSSDPSSMPKSTRPKDRIFQISCVFARQGDKDEKKTEKYILSLGTIGKEHLDSDIIVIASKDESEILLKFVELMQSKQPNIVTGYNIFTFDIPYMIDRSNDPCMYGTEFAKQGMVKNRVAKRKEIEWSSSAYKNQHFSFLDVEGRIFVDLLPLVRRDYKLDNYKLKTIALHFLKDMTKDPLDARGIFRCYDLGMQGSKKGEKALAIVAKYCVKDSLLVLKLFEVLTTWFALCEMSKVTNVQIFALYTQGQQLKVFSQVYKKCTQENIVVEQDVYKTDDKYAGATVFDPVPGIYDKVLPMDFSSLYPSTIIAYNICWKTLVNDEKIPDERCHVMEWEDHFGCDHDAKIIRIKELIVELKKVDEQLKELRRQRDLKSNSSLKEVFKTKISDVIRKAKPLRDERSTLKKKIGKNVICSKRRFRWLKEPAGVLPEILKNLLESRSVTKKEMNQVKAKLKTMKEEDENYDETETYCDVLDQRQQALKVSANSAYGSLGVRRGYLPLMAGAMCTTYMGRRAIEKASETITKKYNGVLVYGDSVTSDTPILIRYPNESVDIKTIDTLCSNWDDYDQFKCEQKLLHKEQGYINADVWDGEKWSKIRRVIRHKTEKKLYRVLTHVGTVDVTEDHSLLNKQKQCIKPKEAVIGTELYHGFPNDFVPFDTRIVEGECKTKCCAKCNEHLPEYEFYTNYNKCKKCIYYENHRKQSEVKPYSSDIEYVLENQSRIVTKEEAFIWGFFMADGSCGCYNNKYTWAINNQNLEYLERTKGYLEYIEPSFQFKILDTMESNPSDNPYRSNVYKLVPSGKVKLITIKYRQLLYDKNKHKIVPYPVLNGDREVKQWFLEGYYIGDGYKSEEGKIIPEKVLRMDCKGKIGCQGLFYILKSLGYKVSINTREDKPMIFRLNATTNNQRGKIHAIKKNFELLQTFQFDEETCNYVYDIETESGVFHAGIGELIVKNTDSNYVCFPLLKTPQECWDYASKVAKEVSALFPKPMSLAYEEKIYWRYMILTKKRYMSLECDREGKLSNKISKKGVLLQRRDNCNFVRKVYGDIVMMAFNRTKNEDIELYILEELNKLFSRTYSTSEFVVTKSVASMAEFEEISEDNEELFTIQPVEAVNNKGKKCWKIGDYTVKTVLPSDQAKRTKEMKKKNATTEYDFYLHQLPAQAQLAQKLRNRGQMASAGSRLEYVITTQGGLNAKQYVKIEEREYFLRHSQALEIEYMYYMKQLVNPVDQLLDVVYDKIRELHNKGVSTFGVITNFMANQYKFRLQKMKMLEEFKRICTPKIKIGK